MSARFAILNPCQKRWSDLSGDGRKRFCDECQTEVHALDQYSLEEFAELKRNSGRVCGFLAAESLPEPRSRRAILIGAFFTAISPLMAQSGRVRIRVTDAFGGVIPQAEASLLGDDSKSTRTVKANQEGEIIFSDFPIGVSRLMVSCSGFSSKPLTITIENSDEVMVEAKLQLGTVGTTVEVVPEVGRGVMVVEPARNPLIAHPDPPVEVAQPPRPKRHWWQIFH